MAHAAGGELPLGARDLPENRTEERLAPGLRYRCITRGMFPREAVFTVQVALCRPEELKFQEARVKKLGLTAWLLPAGNGLMSVRVGRMRLRPAADELEKSLKTQGWPDAKTLYTGEDPDADQGPWVIHVLEVSPPFKGRLIPAWKGRRALLTELAQGALAAVNGDFFVDREADGTPGDPTGVLIDAGSLLSEAVPGRSALVWQGKSWRVRPLETPLPAGISGVNRKQGLRRDVGGHETTTRVGNDRVCGTIGKYSTGYALGGGPALLPVLREKEEGFTLEGRRRQPRTAVGVCPDGRLLLMVIDGSQPEWSVGATFAEEAAILKALGATQALNLDGGGSSTMVIRGKIVNRPSEGRPRPIGDGLLLMPGR